MTSRAPLSLLDAMTTIGREVAGKTPELPPLPADTDSRIFLMRAIERIGATIHGAAWAQSTLADEWPTLSSLANVGLANRNRGAAYAEGLREGLRRGIKVLVVTACSADQLRAFVIPFGGGEERRIEASDWHIQRSARRLHGGLMEGGGHIYIARQSLDSFLLGVVAERSKRGRKPRASKAVNEAIASLFPNGVPDEKQDGLVAVLRQKSGASATTIRRVLELARKR